MKCSAPLKRNTAHALTRLLLLVTTSCLAACQQTLQIPIGGTEQRAEIAKLRALLDVLDTALPENEGFRDALADAYARLSRF